MDVGLEAEPVEVVEDRGLELGPRPIAVVVFDAQQDLTSSRPGLTPHVNGVHDVAEVEESGGRGGKAGQHPAPSVSDIDPKMMTAYDDVIMRTIIELPPAHLEGLDAVCRRERISRAEVVRRAVARLLAEERPAAADEAFGLWGASRVDGLDYERRLRAEWAAPRQEKKKRTRRG